MPLFAFLALALSAPTQATPVPAPAPECGVRVEFASYAMGIDRTAFDKVQALLKRDARVRGVAVQRWGREGETTLCVQLRGGRDARAVFNRVKAVLPARPRGPIRVEAANGLRFSAPRAR